jgi:nitroimidazol reductase NimA-like FMN-containing flavoprotein (pyridoxamine 5'-phosphate oxidase superfamily)
MLMELRNEIPACITVTLLDGLVLARSAFHHSMNYRSVVALGVARLIDDPERKMEALEAITEHIVPGRWAEARRPTPKELSLTTVLEFPLNESSAKIRTGPPIDDDEDYALPIWAGELPFTTNASAPVPDPRLAPGIKPPPYVTNYARPKTGV